MALSKVILNEISSAEIDPYYSMFGGLISTDDDLLRMHLAGDITRYQQLELDGTVSACLQKRKMAVVSREWALKPASDKPRDIAVTELIRKQLEEILFDNICLSLLDAILVGFVPAEIIWGQDKKQVKVQAVRTRNPARFSFVKSKQAIAKDVANYDGYELRLLKMGSPLTGVSLPDRKFIVFSYGSKTSNPYGVGLGSKLWWPVLFKKEIDKASLVYADRFASPTILGFYQPTQDAQSLENFLQSIHGGSYAALPEGYKIQLLEAQRSGTADIYRWMLEYWDKQISRIILSEMFGGEAQGLSGAPAKIDEGVRLEIVKADSDLLSAAINQTLIKWLSEYNDPSATPPWLYRIFSEEEDLNQRASRDKTLYDMGFRLTLEAVKRIYGDNYEDMQGKPNPLDSELSNALGNVAEPEPQPEPEALDNITITGDNESDIFNPAPTI